MSQLTQDSLIEALRSLRSAHPDLPDICWEISPYCSVGLRGHGHTAENDLKVLEQYAEVIGGQIEATHKFTAHRGELQSLLLKGTWAEVPICLTGSVSIEAYAAYREQHPQAVAA